MACNESRVIAAISEGSEDQHGGVPATLLDETWLTEGQEHLSALWSRDSDTACERQAARRRRGAWRDHVLSAVNTGPDLKILGTGIVRPNVSWTALTSLHLTGPLELNYKLPYSQQYDPHPEGNTPRPANSSVS